MADLQSCYFCGAPDDVSEYAVVPPRLGGGDRSVALCPDCKTKLLGVMDPLIERAEAGAPQDTDGTQETDGSPAEQPSSEQSAPTADSTADEITMSPGGSRSDPTASDDAEADSSAPTDDAATNDSSATDSPANDSTAAPSPPASGDDTPPQYRRAMRMLSNRPFPIPRTEVESMLANAYDLEREEIEAVISHAVDEGRLVEENGELREP